MIGEDKTLSSGLTDMQFASWHCAVDEVSDASEDLSNMQNY